MFIQWTQAGSNFCVIYKQRTTKIVLTVLRIISLLSPRLCVTWQELEITRGVACGQWEGLTAGIDQSEASSSLWSSPRRCKDIDIDALQCGDWLTKNNLTRAFNKLNKFSQNETLIKVEASFKPNANKKTDMKTLIQNEFDAYTTRTNDKPLKK